MTATTRDLAALEATLHAWVGRTEATTDEVAPRLVRGMAAALDWDAAPSLGEPLPPGWHWTLFDPAAPTAARGLGPDGHPARGGFLPPVPLQRRMWAGGRLWFHAPIPVGATVQRRQSVAAVTVKSGRSGPLVFVTLRKEICVGADAPPALIEEHDVVYRDPPGDRERAAATAAPADPPAAGRWRREYVADSTLLFRYSALTFNGHRIHYDHLYATAVEGHEGLVVHGPLLATLAMDLAQSALGRPLRAFSFRVLATIYVDRPFSLHADPAPDGGLTLWGVDDRGRVALRATAQ